MMPSGPRFPIVAVDIGNNRIKLGWFDAVDGPGLPKPTDALHIAGEAPELDRIPEWMAGRQASWWIGSVNRPTASRLLEWIADHSPSSRVTLLGARDLPLEVDLQRPDMVGIDRLLDAVAVNQLRRPGRAAVVVDIGSAITVDLVSPQGRFLGGAIAPGIGMSARAMHAFTDLLPLVEAAEFAAPPPALGTSTVAAMRSGLFWGAVGTVRELVARLSAGFGCPAEVFLTGGAGPSVAELLGPEVRHIPHLTLAGIALAAQAAALNDGE
jgi:type III pantothenate kinase